MKYFQRISAAYRILVSGSHKKRTFKDRYFQNAKRYEKGEFEIEGKMLSFPDKASFRFMMEEIFDREVYKFNTKVDNPMIIDCGANVGLSVIYFKKLYPKCKIVAFEPDPIIYGYLVKNIALYNFSDVELINAGLWSEECEMEFDHEGSDAGRIGNLVESDSANKTKIKCVKLSNFLRSSVDFLKMDIEGAEIPVIFESNDKLHLCKKIFIEYHSFSSTNQKLHELLQVLNEKGFRYYLQSQSYLDINPFVNNVEYLGMDNLISIYANQE